MVISIIQSTTTARCSHLTYDWPCRKFAGIRYSAGPDTDVRSEEPDVGIEIAHVERKGVFRDELTNLLD